MKVLARVLLQIEDDGAVYKLLLLRELTKTHKSVPGKSLMLQVSSQSLGGHMRSGSWKP